MKTEWPCRICHLFKIQHIEDNGLFNPTMYSCPEKFQGGSRGNWDATRLLYTPMENFEYIEWITKQKESKKKPTSNKP